jgi:hypothetical protein
MQDQDEPLNKPSSPVIAFKVKKLCGLTRKGALALKVTRSARYAMSLVIVAEASIYAPPAHQCYD